MNLLYENESYKIRGAAFRVYKQLGCGHKEPVYQKSFFRVLINEGLKAEREKRLDVIFEGEKVGTYISDFLVEDKIIIELKAKAMVTKQDIQQFWQYLTSTNYKLGFLINFGKPGGVQIIRRVYDKARPPQNYTNKVSA
ncbi:MAG: GxxExxY protein [bacterium]